MASVMVPVPDFSVKSNISAVKSGLADDPTTWNLNRPLQVGDFFTVRAGLTLTWNLSTCPALGGGYVQGGLTVNNGTRAMQLATLFFDTGSTFKIGSLVNNIPFVGSFNCTITDTATDPTFDPGQFGTGILARGSNFDICGTVKTGWVWSQGCAAGATTITLMTAPSGWGNGDSILIPYPFLTPANDETLPGSVSGTTLTLNSPTQFSHLGQTIDFSTKSWSGGGINFTNSFTLAQSGLNVNVTSVYTANNPTTGASVSSTNSYTVWKAFIPSANTVQFLIPIANLTRNIVFQSANPGTPQNPTAHRGHVMMMPNAAGTATTQNIGYSSWIGLGRTVATQAVSDPQQDASGNLVAGTAANPRWRYSLLSYQNLQDTQQTWTNNVAINYLKSAFVNRWSNVNCTGSVAYNGQGCGFWTEQGQEIGEFDTWLAVRALGTPEVTLPFIAPNPNIFAGDSLGWGGENEGSTVAQERIAPQDFGWEGAGVFFQGTQVKCTNGAAVGCNFGIQFYPGPNPRGGGILSQGFNIYGQSIIATTFPKEYLPVTWGYTPAADPNIYGVPFLSVSDNTSIGCAFGFRADYTGYQIAGGGYFANQWGAGNPGAYIVNDQSCWNITQCAVFRVYAAFFKHSNNVLIGPNYAVNSIAQMLTMQYDNDDEWDNPVIIGWEVGLEHSERGSKTVDGFYQNVYDHIALNSGGFFGGVESRALDYRKLNYQITSNPQFGQVTTTQLNGRTRYNCYLGTPWTINPATLADAANYDPNILFQPRVMTLPDGTQNYWPQQVSSYVPFPPAGTNNIYAIYLLQNLGSTFQNLTNAQINSTYGVTVLNDVAQAAAVPYPIITNGTIGPAGNAANASYKYFGIFSYYGYSQKNNPAGPFFLCMADLLVADAAGGIQGPPYQSVSTYTVLQPGYNFVTFTDSSGFVHAAVIEAFGNAQTPYVPPTLTADTLFDGDFSLTPPKSGETINCTNVNNIPWKFSSTSLHNSGSGYSGEFFAVAGTGTTISQQLLLNGSYTVTYSLQQNGMGLQVLLDSTVLQTIPAGSSTVFNSYTTPSFNASGTHTLTFKSAGTAGEGRITNVTLNTGAPVAPATPTGLSAAPTSATTISISWNTSAGATSYTLQRSTDNATWSGIATQSANSFGDTGLTSNTQYFYRVDATNSIGSSAFSASVNATTGIVTPATPTGLAAAATGTTTINISWNPSSGASTYTLQRSPDNATWAGIATQAGTTFTDTGRTPATQYFYRVDATNSGGSSAFSASVNATTSPVIPSTPTGLAASATGSTTINVSWNTSSGASTYTLQRSTDNATWSGIATQAGTSFADSGLSPATQYFYRVDATNSAGSSSFSASVNATTAIAAPSTPTGLAATATGPTAINVSWNATSGAATYTLQRSPDNSTWATISTNQTGTTFADSGLTAATTYYYRVNATNSGGSSAFSSSVNTTTTVATPSTPTGLAASATSSSAITVNWNSTAGAASYTLQRSTDNATWQNVSNNQTGTSFGDTGLAAGTTYYYRVDATNAGGTSAFSSSVNATTTPAIPSTPTGLAAAGISSSAVNISWNSSAGAATYTLQRSPDNSTWANLVSQAGTTFSDTALASNTTYFYRVNATNSAGSSAFSSSVSATTDLAAPATPTGLAVAAVSSSAINVSWNSSATASTYTLQRSTDNATWSGISTQSGTTFADSGLVSNTTYFYRVSATNSAGPSAFSSSVNTTTALAIPATPTGLAATSISSTQINLSWNTSAGAATYTVNFSTDGGVTYNPLVTQAGNTFSHTGLTPATTYFYKVDATNSAGSSAFSSAISATTSPVAPATPTGLTATATSTTAINISWNAAAGASTYTLQWSLDNATWNSLTAQAGTTFSHTGLSVNTKYYYRVEATNSAGSSAFSTSVNATTFSAAPATPTGLTATVIGPTEIDLTWNTTALAATYDLRRSTDQLSWTVVDPLDTDEFFADTGVVASTTYFYQVRANNSSGSSAWSASVQATTPAALPPAPATPAGLTLLSTGTQTINVSWNTVATANSYVLQRSLDGTTWSPVGGTLTGTMFGDTGLAVNTLYYYRVQAVNAGGSSAFTAAASVATQPLPLPSIPGTVTAVAMSPTSVKVTWTPSTNATTYSLQRSASGGTFQTIQQGLTGTSFTDTSLTPGTKYTYQAAAQGPGGSSSFSTSASATTPIPISSSASPGPITRVSLFNKNGILVASVTIPASLPPLILYQGKYYVYSQWIYYRYIETTPFAVGPRLGEPPLSAADFPIF